MTTENQAPKQAPQPTTKAVLSRPGEQAKQPAEKPRKTVTEMPGGITRIDN